MIQGVRRTTFKSSDVVGQWMQIRNKNIFNLQLKQTDRQQQWPCQISLGKGRKQTFGVPPAASTGAKAAHKHTPVH